MDISIQNNHLISIKDFRMLISTEYPNEKAKIIADYFKDYIIISNEYIYLLQDDMIYLSFHTNIDKIIITKTTNLIEQSFKSFSDDDLYAIEKEYPNYKSIFQNKSVKAYYEQLYIYLQDNTITFTNY